MIQIVEVTVILIQAYVFCEFKAPTPHSSGCFIDLHSLVLTG